MEARRNLSLNLNVRGLQQSPTLDIQARVRALRADGRKVYNLGLGESPFPVPAPLVETLRAKATRKEYLPVEGLPALRQAVAEHLERTQNVVADPQNVLVGPGSKELLFLLQLCFYGDIIVPNPCWVSYTPQARIMGRNVRRVPTTAQEGWKISPDLLAQALEEDHDRYRPRLFVLNYPANPTGVSYTGDELRALAKVARDYEVLILSDEIYSGLNHQGGHVSIARYYPEGTIVLDGISKWAGAGGWRLGVFTFCEGLDWLRQAMGAVASETYTSVCTPVQYAAVRAFESDLGLERTLHHQQRILRRITGEAQRRLNDAGAQVVPADGAFYLFPDFGPMRRRLVRRGIHTGAELCQTILNETGVAMLPGSAFQRPRDEFTARMSLVDFDGAHAMAKSEETGPDHTLPESYLEETCEHMFEGIDRLCTWMGRRA